MKNKIFSVSRLKAGRTGCSAARPLANPSAVGWTASKPSSPWRSDDPPAVRGFAPWARGAAGPDIALASQLVSRIRAKVPHREPSGWVTEYRRPVAATERPRRSSRRRSTKTLPPTPERWRPPHSRASGESALWGAASIAAAGFEARTVRAHRCGTQRRRQGRGWAIGRAPGRSSYAQRRSPCRMATGLSLAWPLKWQAGSPRPRGPSPAGDQRRPTTIGDAPDRPQ